MIEQVKNIINELQASHSHLVALCSITGAEEEHSVHLLVMTDGVDPESPTILVNKDLKATVEEFRREIDYLNEEMFDCKLQAYIPDLWALFYGLDGNEIEGMKEILDEAIYDTNDWSLNNDLGIGIRIEIG